MSTHCPCDLSDIEWAKLAPLLPLPKPGGRPRSDDPLRALQIEVDKLLAALFGPYQQASNTG